MNFVPNELKVSGLPTNSSPHNRVYFRFWGLQWVWLVCYWNLFAAWCSIMVPSICCELLILIISFVCFISDSVNYFYGASPWKRCIHKISKPVTAAHERVWYHWVAWLGIFDDADTARIKLYIWCAWKQGHLCRSRVHDNIGVQCTNVQCHALYLLFIGCQV